MPRLFAYGTLMIDEVIKTLLDRVPNRERTTAEGWRVAQLVGRLYPGLVGQSRSVASGTVYTDLTADEWILLDTFEDPSYTLNSIALTTGGIAYTYVWPEWPAEVHTGDWKISGLTATAIETYLIRCEAWRKTYEAKKCTLCRHVDYR